MYNIEGPVQTRTCSRNQLDDSPTGDVSIYIVHPMLTKSSLDTE
jgi:hypothetical protein